MASNRQATSYRLTRRARVAPPAPVLDERQRAVVDHPGGPLLVLAGPGTGKTTTLVETVVARAGAGVDIDSMLMLTFSRRAAADLRARVTARLGRTVREPVARTLHSYAFGLLRIAAVERGDPAPRLLGGAEQDIVIRQLLQTSSVRWPDSLGPALRTDGFAAELRELLMRAIERGHDPESLARLGHDRGRADWVAAAEFLREYQDVTVFRNPGGYDPAELIRSAVNELAQNPELLATERRRRRRIYVDEYQDTDPAQAALLQLLADGADELILVGDPDQSIYAFRGADASAINRVDDQFGAGRPVPRIALQVCRRSAPELVEATRRVAALLPGPREHRALVPAGGPDHGRVDVSVFRSASEQAAYLAGELRRAHLDGLDWSRMAVLVRSTTQSLGTLRRAMISAGVPVEVRGDDLPLVDQPPVTLLMTVYRATLDDVVTDELAEDLMTGPIGGGDSLRVRRLRRELRRTYGNEQAPLAAIVQDPLAAQVLPEHVGPMVVRVARTLAAAREAVAAGADAEQLLWAIWDASGLARRWQRAGLRADPAAASANRDLDSVLALFDEAARYVDRLPGDSPRGFDQHLAAQQIPGDTFAAPGVRSGAVAILTAHASKGLEWDLVCVADVQEGRWPDLRRRGTLLGSEALVDVSEGIEVPPAASAAPMLAEERRLFYVAATRAASRLVVTAVLGEEEQPSRFLDELAPVAEPRAAAPLPPAAHLPGLVAELRAVVCNPGEAAPVREAAAAELATLAASGVPGADPADWWGLAPLSTTDGVRGPDETVRVSPSRIESFLQCELRTLMQQFGVDDRDNPAAELGTLIHALAESAPEGQTLAEFERTLDLEFHRLDFGAAWLAENERERAGRMLATLVRWLTESRAALTLLEREKSFEVTVGDAVLAGSVDRLEQDRDGRLVVVDLKTGKGKPSSEDLGELPQLGAYQLAIRHGAFPEHGTEPGGAVLVQLAKPGRGGDPEQRQSPLGPDDDWARAQVDHVVERMRGHEFLAVENPRCQICDVRTSCPLQPGGRQVP